MEKNEARKGTGTGKDCSRLQVFYGSTASYFWVVELKNRGSERPGGSRVGVTEQGIS